MTSNFNIPSCAIVVTVYKKMTPIERVILANNAKVLKEYHFIIMGPKNAISRVSEAEKLVKYQGVDVQLRYFPDDNFANIACYNTLLKSHRFLEVFNGTDFILISQLDAVILSDELEGWLMKGFDFVRAPHFKGYSAPDLPPRFISGANGGLSLRRIEALKRALDIVHVVDITAASKRIAKLGLPKLCNRLFGSKPWLLSRPDVNEDIFWSVLIPRIVSEFQVAPPQVSSKFAFEVLPRYLFELNSKTLPFGCYAWQK